MPVQQRLLDALRTPGIRYVGFGGGIRGTKTWGGLGALVTLGRIFPKSRWIVVRKDLERLRKNTLPSFNKLREQIGSFVGEMNQSTWIAKLGNGSEIAFFGENYDEDKDLSRWKGLEPNGFLLEEADELQEASFYKAMERAGAWIVPDGGAQPPPYVLATFNPCPNWPKRVFYEPWKNGTIKAPYAFIPATQADNPFIPEATREAWKNLPEQEYKRFVEGDWDVLTGRYYDMLDARIHLSLKRSNLPEKLPAHWEYWGAFDWGYAHWAVFSLFAKDTQGTTYLLDSWWARRQQDDELAKGCIRLIDEYGLTGKLQDIYAGHDVWAKVTARAASGVTTADVFAAHGLWLVKADIDRTNGGRALRRALKVTDDRPGLYIIDTPSNRRIYDQLAEAMPDENDVNKPAKVDADAEGRGGDDGADCARYGIASRIQPATTPSETFPDSWTPDRDDEAYRPAAALPALTYVGGYPIDGI